MDSVLPFGEGGLPLGLLIVDAQTRVRYANGYLQERLDFTNNGTGGSELCKLFPNVGEDALLEIIKRCQEGASYNDNASCESLEFKPNKGNGFSACLRCALSFAFTCSTGENLYALILYEVVPEDAGDEFHASFGRALQCVCESRAAQRRLLTEMRMTREHLARSEKLAGIGQLAAGVAHEINNPLGYVFSNLRSLRDYVDDLLRIINAVDVARNLDEIKSLKKTLDYEFIRNDVDALVGESAEGVERVKTIIRALQDFSRVDIDDYRLADIHQGIETTLNVAASELRYKAKIVKEYGSIPDIYCNISQINQVLLNLLLNAAYAISDHGVVTIRTGSDQRTVWFEVEDTGHGMTPEKIEEIFNPFYTTKPPGAGTGLGLAVSYGIVQQHRGRIEVRSQEGSGSCFRVILPIDPSTEVM